MAKLKDIHERGSGIRTKTGETLTGSKLLIYIEQTRKRLEITKCLSREAADYAYRLSQIRK
ncbi:MAG: hypothetical protein OXR84_05240 [Magnetovibrio sp.]|nr:hypothetical protein [Magnetovibrio sp.]